MCIEHFSHGIIAGNAFIVLRTCVIICGFNASGKLTVDIWRYAHVGGPNICGDEVGRLRLPLWLSSLLT
jgi:hypothetical protein